MNKRLISVGSFAFMLCLVIGFIVLWSVCCEAGWIRTYGGASSEYATSLARTSDGGYVLAGTTNDKCLVVKFDSVWNIAWQKTYGGSGTDVCGSIEQTEPDLGYIVAGSTTSFGAGVNVDGQTLKGCTDK